MSRKIIITGSSGYLGQRAVSALCDRGFEVIALDLRRGEIDSSVKFIEGDFTKITKEQFMSFGVPDVCLHMAWRNGFDHNANSHIDDLPSHLQFLVNMASWGVGQIAVIGSVHEIGYFEGEVDEETPTNPQSLYGISKNALRMALEIKLRELNVIFQWIRLFYIYGDFERGQSVFSKILTRSKNGEKTIPFTSGTNKFDFITIDEVSEQISLVVAQTQVNGIINCCTGVPIALKEMVNTFIKTNKLEILPEYGVFPDRSYDSPAIWGSTKKIELMIGKTFEN